MANLKEIKNRIQSIENTKKITRAMKMVAAAKVKKAETTVKAARPFSSELAVMFKKMLSAVSGEYSASDLKIKSAVDNYPVLLEKRDVKSAGILVITSNKGLAAAYNSNVIKRTLSLVAENTKNGIKSILFIIGQKGVSGLKKKIEGYDCEIAKTYIALASDVTSTGVGLVTEDLAEYFVNKQIDDIKIVTTRFKNMMSYSVENWDLLPLSDEHEDEVHEIDPLMIFEPNIHSILQKLVPMYLTNIIYQALLEAQASELASRMTAMSAASNNAEEMIRVLSIEYNKARQGAITQELTEIVSGADALKG